jgi:hypothetical protein
MWKVRDICPNGRLVGITQGTYYAATGLWPILWMRSFEAVTGPKQDHWLVKTVGALVRPSVVTSRFGPDHNTAIQKVMV